MLIHNPTVRQNELSYPFCTHGLGKANEGAVDGAERFVRIEEILETGTRNAGLQRRRRTGVFPNEGDEQRAREITKGEDGLCAVGGGAKMAADEACHACGHDVADIRIKVEALV